MRPDDEREEYLSPARAILSGGVRDGWVDRYYKTCLSRKRLVKDIRTHLMLGWIHARFPGMQIIFLLRHPCAVVTSKIKLGWNTPGLETTFLAQEELVRDFLLPFADATKQARTSFERHVFAWCVENYVPLMQLLGQEGVQLVLYE